MGKLQARLVVFIATLILAGTTHARTAEQNYQSFCVSCHGPKLDGGLGGSLIDDQWNHGGTDADMARVIREGIPAKGMPAWGKVLGDDDIRALIIFIREQGAAAKTGEVEKKAAPDKGVFKSSSHNFTLEKVADGFGILWAVDFLPDNSLLVTQRDGHLWQLKDGKRTEIKNIPEVWANSQGGLLDVAVKPGEAESPWVYLTYSQPHNGNAMTAVVRGKIRDTTFADQQTIFSADKKFYTDRGYHFGSRVVFDGDYIYFGVGDRGARPQAQDVTRPNGKIHRLYADGRVPDDNPFMKQADAIPSIWAFGVRNPQGMTLAADGTLWETEHGPRGGDEVNIIEKAVNYGWPVITYGMNYDGTPMTDKTSAPGMAQPKHYWVPSIAVTAIAEYRGDAFPRWQNQLLVGSLAKQEVQLLTVNKGEITHSELLMKNQGRVRDLVVGPDGLVYLVLTLEGDQPGAIYRMRPAN